MIIYQKKAYLYSFSVNSNYKTLAGTIARAYAGKRGDYDCLCFIRVN